MNEQLNLLAQKMMEYYSGDAKRIQHFIKVCAFAKYIGDCECLSAEQMLVLQAAAYVHDIGIKPAEAEFGYNNGKLQEQFGAEPARQMFESVKFSKDVVSRAVYLVAHHHTYNNIDGIDYQILVEADFLVNLFEDDTSKKAIIAARDKIFKTKTGIRLINTIYGI